MYVCMKGQRWKSHKKEKIVFLMAAIFSQSLHAQRGATTLSDKTSWISCCIMWHYITSLHTSVCFSFLRLYCEFSSDYVNWMSKDCSKHACKSSSPHSPHSIIGGRRIIQWKLLYTKQNLQHHYKLNHKVHLT